LKKIDYTLTTAVTTDGNTEIVEQNAVLTAMAAIRDHLKEFQDHIDIQFQRERELYRQEITGLKRALGDIQAAHRQEMQALKENQKDCQSEHERRVKKTIEKAVTDHGAAIAVITERVDRRRKKATFFEKLWAKLNTPLVDRREKVVA
jgi:phage-related minor tail protein